MFVPKLYRSEDMDVMREIIKENSFALLISSVDKIRATHSMMMLNENDPENVYIETHISRVNPQARTLKNGDEVLCDFLGSHAYISSSWYDHINVSTWNYEAVQIYGKVELMNHDELYAHLEKLTSKYENFQQCPVMVKDMGKEFVEKEMKGAFGMKILPTEIFIKQKLSQNRKENDFQNIILHLEESADDNARKIAEKMKLIKKK
ncbi:FMN-binding negative transcriptional regulator [Chryseobacterium arthrosphaerae]|uniref:Transcriptional regulator n=1 Tax=Chryseobacterium arthrosphaerae TaxID=651561 RepID=A0A1B8ZV48_9FLAO|nr:FMN-binding negative transcriptional regulator [Chryseobacterium arthrosphaerae]MDG4652785.1 FMN-binding negative transcriptional regulator [Chryseobacterium arthrosphaerae]OCA75466.1 transcriptional regulator [Chryseobacterium arthrosphaerae]RTZ50004.1 FMN-binding negative transcriptional regulator [Chryseobacterium arthrosphaerae]UEQ74613.1 FMN-binding negative transcriptional regulator [Chryseobacterium arthrosphaerae]WES95865.1 FMN-binding negative transcriptional regulator [Chryseobact